MTTTSGPKTDISEEHSTDALTGDKEIPDKKKEEEEEEIPNLGGIGRINKEFGPPFICLRILGYICAFLNGCMMPLFAVIFAEILKILAKTVDSDKSFASQSTKPLLYFIGMGTGALIFNTGQYFFWGIYASKISIAVRQAYFGALTQQEIGYHEIETSGKLNSRLTTECFAIQQALGTKFGFLLQQLFSFVFGMVLAFAYSWELTLILLATMPVLVIIGVIQGKLFVSAGGKDADPFVNAGAFSQEVLTNIRTVLAFPTLVSSKAEEYIDLLKIASPIAVKRSFYVGIGLGFFMFGMFSICYSVGLYAGARFVDSGAISVADMFAAFFAFMTSGMGLGQLGSVMGDLKKGDIGANKFYSVYERKPNIRNVDKDKELILLSDSNGNNISFTGDIELENITFSYPSAPDTIVLNNVNISIPHGQTLAIVGPSGSGKSTIISLLERYYEPKSGSIRIANEEIHNYDLQSLRSRIGLVSQMPLLFDSTIFENIKGGNNNVTKDDVIRAATLANAHDFILKLSNGYDTNVGELGGRLSGGQRQRICIARAIVKVPSILLLDEATSALDTKSEKEVQAALDKITQELQLTTVVIAHRLSTIKDADKIMVLVDGEVEEIGSHQDLINENGVYATLVSSQLLLEEKKQEHAQSRHDYVVRRDSSKNLLSDVQQEGIVGDVTTTNQ